MFPNKLLKWENYCVHDFCKETQKARPCNFPLVKRYIAIKYEV